MSLWAQFLTNDQRTVHKWTHYFPAYERHLERFRNLPITLLEIGCGAGGSLQMWKRYLGPHAQIVGIDINAHAKTYEEEQIAVRIGDQGDTAFLASLADEFGPFDVVIDDGSHQMAHLITSFRALYPRVQPAGVYILEDLHTCYWPKYGGGLREPGSFMELAKDLVDELNADHARGALEPTDFTRSTLSMHFYDSMVVFERGRHLTKHAPEIPPRQPKG